DQPTDTPDLWLQDVTLVFLTVLTILVVILVTSYQVDPATSPSWGGSTPTSNPPAAALPLDPCGHLHLSRNISYPLQQLYLEVRCVCAHTCVYACLALSVLLQDVWSDSQGRVNLDSQQDYQQDYQLMAATQTPEGFSLLFKRPFSTCEPQDYIIEEGTVHLIYGVLDLPIRLLQQLKLSQIETGVQRARLLCPDTPSPSLLQDIHTLEVRNTDVNISTQETTYWCHIFQIPPIRQNNHISVVTPGNKAIVHHMEVFECSPEMDTAPKYSRSCDSKMKSAGLNYCRHILAACAMGAEVTKHCRDGTSHTRTRTPHLGSNSICFLSSALAVRLCPMGGVKRDFLLCPVFRSQAKTRPWRIVLCFENNLMDAFVKYLCCRLLQMIRMLKKMVTVLLLLLRSLLSKEGGFGIMEEMCDNYSNVDHGYLQKSFSFINRYLLGYDATSLAHLYLASFSHSSLQILSSSVRLDGERHCIAIFRSLQRCSIECKSGLWLGHSETCPEATPALTWLCALSLLEGEPSHQSEVLSRFSSRISLYFAPSIFPSILTSLPIPATEKHPHSMMPPPPCFIVGMVPGFLQM
uniref:Dopamine beta-hydroxylase n=1 Tax=Oncorhynchus tshawytscha TaxID=74940 RepID=A0A8C8G3M0_ONCTS